MRWVKLIMLGAVMTAALTTTGCKKPGVVLRDPEVYKNEVYLFQMVIEQDTELLEAHLADGSCSCDEDGNWNNEVCETSALNIVTMRARLDWHVAAMLYLAGLVEENPGEEPPVSEDQMAELCPEG